MPSINERRSVNCLLVQDVQYHDKSNAHCNEALLVANLVVLTKKRQLRTGHMPSHFYKLEVATLSRPIYNEIIREIIRWNGVLSPAFQKQAGFFISIKPEHLASLLF
jgi:hypothetical protein